MGDPSRGRDDTGLIVKRIVDAPCSVIERSRPPRVPDCDLAEDEPGEPAPPTSPNWLDEMFDVRNYESLPSTPYQDLIYGWEHYAKSR